MYSVGGTGWKPCPRNHDGSFRSRLDFLGYIAVGNLEAEDGGRDETQERDEREKDNMLIASPTERVLGLHQFKKSVEGECSQNEC